MQHLKEKGGTGFNWKILDEIEDGYKYISNLFFYLLKIEINIFV